MNNVRKSETSDKLLVVILTDNERYVMERYYHFGEVRTLRFVVNDRKAVFHCKNRRW
jgi:hypothetical protein